MDRIRPQLLINLGEIRLVGWLAVASFGFEIVLNALLGDGDGIAHCLFHFRGKVAQYRPVKRKHRALGILDLPVGPKERVQQGAALGVQRLGLRRRGLHQIRIGRRTPPFLGGVWHFLQFFVGVQLVDIGDDDVADGLLRAADFAEAGDVNGIIRRFNLAPRKKLLADDELGSRVGGVRRIGWGDDDGWWSAVRERNKHRREHHIDDHRDNEQQAPSHKRTLMHRHNSANAKGAEGVQKKYIEKNFHPEDENDEEGNLPGYEPVGEVTA